MIRKHRENLISFQDLQQSHSHICRKCCKVWTPTAASTSEKARSRRNCPLHVENWNAYTLGCPWQSFCSCATPSCACNAYSPGLSPVEHIWRINTPQIRNLFNWVGWSAQVHLCETFLAMRSVHSRRHLTHFTKLHKKESTPESVRVHPQRESMLSHMWVVQST